MKRPANFIPLTLMLSSILLLLVLQFLWLRSSYNKAFEDLHKETNSLFRSTVFAMRDSIIEQSIVPFPGDSAAVKTIDVHGRDPLNDELPDSLIERLKRHERISRVQIVMTPDDSDSLVQVIKPLASKFYNYRGQGNFILRLGQDSLRIDSLERNFAAVLSEAGIDLPFEVIRVKRGEKPQNKKGTFVSELVRINPSNRYAVSFSGVDRRLYGEIVPQMFFCAFLTLLTVGSFYMMYRSVVIQQKMAEMKNDFISNVTHELKTPITTVKVALEALQDFKGLDNPKLTREYLEIAQNELTRLTLLTDKVLKTAIFEMNGIRFLPEKVDVEKLAGQVMASMRLVFEKNDASVSLNKTGSDFVISGSTDHLTNVLYNLFDNALKYTVGPAHVQVGLREDADHILLTVRDAGQGIPAEYHKKVFEKFFRVPTGDVHTVKGYGLGLSYVASVVRSHRGAIRVESEPGQGSCFIITLPKDGKN